MKRRFYTIIFLSSILFVTTLVSCHKAKEYTEDEAWIRIGRFQSANQPDSVEQALQYYLENFPDGKYVTEVNNLYTLFQQEQKQWNHILRHNCSVDAVGRFLLNYPEGFFHAEASQMVDSLTYNKAVSSHSSQAIQAYMDEFPNGRFIQQAKKLLDKIELGNMSIDEKVSIIQTLQDHFHFLTINSDQIESTIAPILSSYMGKTHCSSDDVKVYMEHVHADGRPKLIEPKEIQVKKIESDAGSVYNASFRLVETLNLDDSLHMQVKTFKGIAVLNTYGEITSVVLE